MSNATLQEIKLPPKYLYTRDKTTMACMAGMASANIIERIYGNNDHVNIQVLSPQCV